VFKLYKGLTAVPFESFFVLDTAGCIRGHSVKPPNKVVQIKRYSEVLYLQQSCQQMGQFTGTLSKRL